jgi:hypothetical protein
MSHLNRADETVSLVSVTARLLESTFVIPEDRYWDAWEDILSIGRHNRRAWPLDLLFKKGYDNLVSELADWGFTTSLLDGSGLAISGYDADFDAVDGALRALAPFCEPGAYVLWLVSTGQLFRHIVVGGGSLELEAGSLTWSSVRYEPASGSGADRVGEYLSEVVRRVE